MKYLCLIQARMSSKRLPNKVLLPLLGEPALYRLYQRVIKSKKIQKTIIITSTDSSDDLIQKMCTEKGIEFFRGDLNDVLKRYYLASLKYKPQNIIRITGDCPLIDPQIADGVITLFEQNYDKIDYACNTEPPTFPDGLDVEVFKFTALEEAYKKATLPSEREHVTIYIKKHFRKINFALKSYDYSRIRITLDQEEDYDVVKKLYDINSEMSFKDLIKLFKEKPDLFSNSHIARNEGILETLNKDYGVTFLR